MPSIWKTDKRPRKNTMEQEIERLKRVTVALTIAVEEKRTKHVKRDLLELMLIYDELKRLLEEGDEEEW